MGEVPRGFWIEATRILEELLKERIIEEREVEQDD